MDSFGEQSRAEHVVFCGNNSRDVYLSVCTSDSCALSTTTRLCKTPILSPKPAGESEGEGQGICRTVESSNHRAIEMQEEIILPSLQRASHTSVQNSKSLSVVDVVAVRRRAAPAIGESAVD